MQYLWDVSDCSNEMQAVYVFFQENNITDTKERELYFNYLMNALGKKPMSATELNREELLQDFAFRGNNALSIETDENGKVVYKFIKSKKEDE